MYTMKDVISLFDKEDVLKLYRALTEFEFVRVDLHVFNDGTNVTCKYSDDLTYLEEVEGCAEYIILTTLDLFDAFMEYGTQELREYYNELADEG